MLKTISIISMLAASPLAAQNCDLLCNADNWRVGDPQFILDAIANGEDINTTVDGRPTPLIKTILLGPIEMVPHLIAAGADPNIADSNGMTALMAASNAPDTGLLPKLIAAGADVTAQNQRGQTALHFAAGGITTPQYLAILLAAGADVNAIDANGNTTLHTLADISTLFGEPYQIATNAGILINSGAALNLQNTDRQTALHIAAGGREPNLVSLLIAAGIDGSLLDVNGHSAYNVASETMHLSKLPAVLAALESAQ